MAEERNLATVRATETTDGEDATKEELQRRMEEARESITQTVAEIKDTVTNQYQAVKETVTDALDWREQYRKRPLVFTVGAMSVGFIVGYQIAGAFVGDDADRGDGRYYDADEASGLSRAGAAPASYYSRGETDAEIHPSSSRSYAAQAITGSSYGSSDYDAGSLHERAPSAPSPAAYASAATRERDSAEEEEAKGPGLIERFKNTKAYDRLEEEVATLGDRFLSELSKTATAIVLPALFSKIKELFGVDLSSKKEQGGSTSQQRSSGSSNASAAGGTQTSGQGRGTGNPSAGGSDYATSENRGYGASAGGGDYGRGSE